MIRPLAAAAAVALLTLAGAAAAQTYGQPVYLNAYGRPVGGTPLSEVEMRSYVETGRWADGYSDRPQVYLPGPGSGWGHSAGHGYGRYRPGQAYGRGSSRHDPPSRPGYRDEWGYNDDRPPFARRWSDDRRGRGHERDCGCGDVYLYDR